MVEIASFFEEIGLLTALKGCWLKSVATENLVVKSSSVVVKITKDFVSGGV